MFSDYTHARDARPITSRRKPTALRTVRGAKSSGSAPRTPWASRSLTWHGHSGGASGDPRDVVSSRTATAPN